MFKMKKENDFGFTAQKKVCCMYHNCPNIVRESSGSPARYIFQIFLPITTISKTCIIGVKYFGCIQPEKPLLIVRNL